MVPFILHDEMELPKQEISVKHILMIFDETTTVAEDFVVVLSFVNNWTVVQCVARLMLLAKSMTDEHLARVLVETLSTKLGIASHSSNA